MTVPAPSALQRLRSHSLAAAPRITTAMASQRRPTPITRRIHARPSPSRDPIRSASSCRSTPSAASSFILSRRAQSTTLKSP
jgi:hypothetical protein